MKLALKFAAAVCASASLVACGGQTSVGSDDQDIIGGMSASAKSLDAVGTVGMKDSRGNYEFFCSATLIGPSTVLTAKHCAIVLRGAAAGMKLVNLVPIYFAIGPKALKPTKIVEAIATTISPVDGTDGFVGLGNDVAVYQLVEPITDVKPFKVSPAALREKEDTNGKSDIGSKFIGIGYGAKDIVEDITGDLSGERRMGTETLRALKGQSFALMLGSWEAFYDQMVWVYGKDIVDYYIDIIRGWYDDTKILEGYEAWAGHTDGDVQTCHGDSGGPLLRKQGDERHIYGVVSGGWFSRDLTCDYGTFYATIGPKTQDMIKTALTYKDPCRDDKNALIPVKGRCDGQVAVRCTGKYEGDRRKSAVDCASLDLACKVDAAGYAGCVDPEDVNPDNSPAQPEAPPSFAETKKNVDNLMNGMTRVQKLREQLK